MGEQIEIDKASLAHLDSQLNKLKVEGEKSMFKAMIKLAYKIISTAQLRLTGRGHIVTSRLKNSLAVQTSTLTPPAYTDRLGHSFSAVLNEPIGTNELIAGTNVVYGPKIEQMDSFLYWALKNVDVERTLAQEMKDFMKFGEGLI